MQIAELPGDVLIALRESEGFTSYREFATTLAMDQTTLWRLEKVCWGTLPETWSRRVKRGDLKTLEAAGWLHEGDAWWERFHTAFAWQYLVFKYGERIYTDEDESPRLLEPVWEEHVLAVAQAAVEQYLSRKHESNSDSDEDLESLTVRVLAEVLFLLRVTGHVVQRETDARITPKFERTRGLSDIFGAETDAEHGYMNTLLLTKEWAEETLEELLSAR